MTEKKFSRRDVLTLLGLASGGIIFAKGFYGLRSISEVENITRYNEIQGKLRSSPNVSLRDLQARNEEILAQRVRLIEEEAEIMGNPNFNRERQDYEDRGKGSLYTLIGGMTVMLASILQSYIKPHEGNQNNNLLYRW